MAIKTGGKKLSEAELNAPDLDDDGEFDVEHYLVPEAIDTDDETLKQAWALAARSINDTAPEEPVGMEDES